MVPPTFYVIGALAVALIGSNLWHVARVSAAHLQVAKVEKTIETMKGERDKATAALEKSLREHTTAVAKLQSEHAAAQQEKEDAFHRRKAALARDAARDAAAARSLRDRLAVATAAASGGARREVDTSACQRDRDRLEALGRLAGEGQELLVEARSLLDQREAEVIRMQDQLRLDRQAVR